MSTGFGGDPNQNRVGKDANIVIDVDNIDIVIKKYKKIKKYMKSSLYTIKNIDGTEDIVSSLIKEAEENPL
jgi:hypothetical protein